MDITTIIETITPTTVAYFLVGGLAGFILRSFTFTFGRKRPGRYELVKSNSAAKRSVFQSDLNDPAFELPDSVLKTLTANRLSGVGIDDNVNECR